MTAAAEKAPSLSSVVDHLVSDLVERWGKGERPLAESYLDKQPELWERPDVGLELIAEELVLRAEHGEPLSDEDLLQRFPRWQAQVRVLLECQRTLGPQLVAPRFPNAGERVGDFELLSELGRGAHGRVFLATQSALASRPVVLKLSTWGGGEHLSLARLQHTHIVPLYSSHEFPELGLVGLCLPYFGGATLADLPKPGSAAGSQEQKAGADFLERAKPSEAVCWVGACLADALQYAHDRGLLHLDLKPSNVLIAADGTPMLLDFHLAHPPMAAGSLSPTRLGGTAGYMSPEQDAAMKAVVAGAPLVNAVDARSDVYSLGIVLSELWDKLSAGERRSIGLGDILNRCVAPLAEERYPTAAALASDLRRQLMHLPLKGVGNRSLGERWRKWRRRRPLALPLVLSLAALLVAAGGLVRHASRQAERSRDALHESDKHLQQGRYREAADTARSGEVMLEGIPFQPSLRANLASARQAATRAQAADELHRLCESVRPLHSAETLDASQAIAAATRCRELWDRREEIHRALADQPTPVLERRWRADLLDLGILTAHLEQRAAPTGDAGRRALATLAEAEALLGESGMLHLERARHARALGESPLAEESERRSREVPPQTAWEQLGIGRALLASGEPRRALASIEKSLQLDSRSTWGHYYAGVCHLRLNEATEAVAAFSACMALAPEIAWCVYNRGIAFLQAGRDASAVTDFERVLALDPQHEEARTLLVRLRMK
jgi:tetratricopeptide (TPR) repeat protein